MSAKFTEGMQVLVDGVPGVVVKSASHNYRLMVFSPGQRRPITIFGKPMVGQWSDVWMREQTINAWRNGTLLAQPYCAVGGMPRLPTWMNYIKGDVEFKAPDRPDLRPVYVEDAERDGRMELNYDAATHVDYKAWDAAFTEVYANS
jgi:hypothetical protein